ncbi:hypothetical protein TNCV_624801 [Trichonephila clavipes]|nr:hypothetical protein TNCV_624801 [Trichonephila clavipes]
MLAKMGDNITIWLPCNGLPPGEAISSSTRPKYVGVKVRPIIPRLNSDPYRNSTAFSNSASFPSPYAY